MKQNLAVAALLFGALWTSGVSAADMESDLAAAESALKKSFRQFAFETIRPGPFPGIYEIVAGGKIFYYQPEVELLIVGEMYTKDGVSLTRERLGEIKLENLKKIDLSDGLVVGDGERTIVEFTDPDCPFCRKFHEFAGSLTNIRRIVFFSPIDRIHPHSAEKAEHILCSEDSSAAFDRVYAGQTPAQWLRCAEGAAKLARHRQAADSYGVTGTPALVVVGHPVSGFNKNRIRKYLEEG